MNLAHDLIVDPALDHVPEAPKPLATWYTQGHSDGLGDRLLLFDNTAAPSWEILRFNTTVARAPGFEDALRARVEQLRSFRHPAFPVVRAIEELGHEDGLAVASTYAAGVRLCDAPKKPRSAAFVIRLMRQLTGAVAALHRHAPEVAHGALTAERIVIMADGRLMIREHMVGSALDVLGLSAARLWSHFGIVAGRVGEGVALDQRSDLVQLGIVALSLMTGRRVGPDEYPAHVRALLDAAPAASSHPLERFELLRQWILRALQMGHDPFDSAREAHEALAELADETGWPDDLLFPGFSAVRETTDGTASRPRLISTRAAIPAVSTEDAQPESSDSAEAEAPAVEAPPGRRTAPALVGAGLLTIALIVGGVLYVRGAAAARAAAPPQPAALSIDSPEPGAQVWVDDQLVGATPLQLKVDSKVRSIRVLPPPAKASAAPKPAVENVVEPKEAVRPAAAPVPKSGGFRITAPVQIYVLDGERVLGSSSDGPIMSSAGAHAFEFVNTAIGFREKKTITVKPGQVTTLPVNVPNGTLSVNAAPWASVWLDGNAIGDTPIGNMPVAPGQHEIVFRHPQLGDRRQTTIVRVDGPTSVSANLQR